MMKEKEKDRKEKGRSSEDKGISFKNNKDKKTNKLKKSNRLSCILSSQPHEVKKMCEAT